MEFAPLASVRREGHARGQDEQPVRGVPGAGCGRPLGQCVHQRPPEKIMQFLGIVKTGIVALCPLPGDDEA